MAGSAWALPTSEFRYLRDEGAAQCPSEGELRAAVSARLGYDPFQKGAPRTIRASIETMTEGFRARIELEGGHEGPAQREIVTKGSCLELVSAIALSISLAIDAERSNANGAVAAMPSTTESTTTGAPPASAQPPKTITVVQPKPEAPPEPKPEPPAKPHNMDGEEPSEPMPVPARRRGPHVPLPLDFAVGADLQVHWGAAPSTAVGGLLFVQGRHDWLSLELGLRVDAPAGKAIADGASMRTGVVGFQLAPCAHFRAIGVCAVGLMGEIWASSQGLPINRTDLAFYSAAGLRLGLEWPRNAAWALSAHLDAMALLTRIKVMVDSDLVWEAPGSFASLAAGALVRF